MIEHPALILALALSAGMIGHGIASRLEIPSIIVLLTLGVLLGPEVLGLITPQHLGSGLQMIVGISVAVILFEGGLNLDLKRLRNEATVIRRLVLFGALVTGIGGAVAARIFMGWSWEIAALFGTLVIVTGPTVMTPLLRGTNVNRNVRTILEGEGLLIDPVGAILAVVTAEVVLTRLATEAGTGTVQLLGLPSRILVGGGLGLIGGLAIGFVLRRGWLIPEGLENVFTLSFVLLLFESSEAVQAESGILAAALAGMVVGNMGIHVEQELKEFKEELTMLLIGLLFVLLATTVTLGSVLELGWGGVLTIAALILVVRPLGVALCSAGTDLDLRERAFIGWLAPRGIVAAAMASLIAQWLTREGHAGGSELQALVFLVIAVTVVLQGGTAGLLADRLGLREDGDRGFAIVGANPLGRLLARVLRAEGEEAVLVDCDDEKCREAEEEGLAVIHGDAVSDRIVLQADLELRHGIVTATPNQSLNLLLARELNEKIRVDLFAGALDRRHSGLSPDQLNRTDVQPLFGVPVDIDRWDHALRQGRLDVAAWELQDGEGLEDEQLAPDRRLPELARQDALALVRVRDGRAEPLTGASSLAPGDVVYFAWPYADGRAVGEWLARHGWRPRTGSGE